MLDIKPTEHLTGVTISGDYETLYQIVEAMHNMTEMEEDYSDPYYGIQNQLLAICYDIRHAFMGDREVRILDNGMTEDLMKYHGVIAPKQNVYYSVNVLFPLAIFVAESLPTICRYGRRYYRSKKSVEIDLPLPPYREYLRDKGLLENLRLGTFAAMAEVIGDDAAERIVREVEEGFLYFNDYAIQYVDKCNVELLSAPMEKRANKIKLIANRLMKRPVAYQRMAAELMDAAKEYDCSIYQLRPTTFDYPETIEW